jgi:hypothetical protein
MSDLSAVDQLREQLNITAMRSGIPYNLMGPLYTDHLIRRLLPIVAAYGDAREAAGREQGRQDAAEAVSVYRDEVLASFSRDETLGRTMAAVANEWLSRARSAARGSGVVVQPTDLQGLIPLAVAGHDADESATERRPRPARGGTQSSVQPTPGKQP